tara:strand:- start:14237 stop:14566 length:330 start_codon:yes stop_codon:yes gene_type:complete
VKKSLFLLAGLVLVSTGVHAKDDAKMQVETDAATGAVVEPSDKHPGQGEIHRSPKARAHVPGVKSAADPEPNLRQGPLGGTMVETPDYMRPQETMHLPDHTEAEVHDHE